MDLDVVLLHKPSLFHEHRKGNKIQQSFSLAYFLKGGDYYLDKERGDVLPLVALKLNNLHICTVAQLKESTYVKDTKS